MILNVKEWLRLTLEAGPVRQTVIKQAIRGTYTDSIYLGAARVNLGVEKFWGVDPATGKRALFWTLPEAEK